jgi:hypothetical protein
VSRGGSVVNVTGQMRVTYPCLSTLTVRILDADGTITDVRTFPSFSASISFSSQRLNSAENYTIEVIFRQDDPAKNCLNEAVISAISISNTVAGGAASCTLCDAGTFSDASASACTLCPPGSASSSPGSPTCVPCNRGFVSERPGARSCVPCGATTDSNADGTSCVHNCTFAAASGYLYDLRPLADPANMQFAGVYQNHEYYLNLCTREHSNRTCTDGKGNSIATYGCQHSYTRAFDSDIGSIMGFRRLNETQLERGEGLLVELTQGTAGCASTYGTARPRQTKIRMVCDVNAGTGASYQAMNLRTLGS